MNITVLTILGLVFGAPFTACTQDTMSSRQFVPYDAIWAEKDYQKALHYEESGQTTRAIYCYRRVLSLDSTSQTGCLAKAKLDAILAADLQFYKKELEGSWRWMWSGSNWGMANEPAKCKCEKSLVFQGNMLSILQNDIVVDTLHFSIVIDYSTAGTYLVYLKMKETNDTWLIDIKPQPFYYVRSKRTTPEKEKYLKVQVNDLNCVCGCFEEIFEKK